MSFFGQPKAPNPFDSASTQLQFNQSAAQDQNKVNMINQVTPFGSLAYSPDPNSPGGYTATSQLSPEQQKLLSTQQATKQNFGQAAQDLSGSYGFGGMYGSMPNIDPSSLTNKMMGWGQQYMQPLFNMQQSNLDAKLRNQGITPGSEAWNNAQNLQSRNVNNAYQNLFLNAEPTAFNQAIQEYQLPMQTAYGLMGAGAPVNPTGTGNVQTPTATVGAPNYQQAQQYSTNLQQQQFQNLMQGAGQVAGMFAGGW